MPTRKTYIADMFAGNFIKEIESILIPSTDPNRKKGKRVRQILLECFQCKRYFSISADSAIRTQQKCCSNICYKKLIEIFPGGNERHPLYPRWLSMNQRCNNKSNVSYKNWGGRGISIYKGWESFPVYVSYVESLPGYDINKTIDRIDNDQGYFPGNIRWASSSTQTANQRPNSRGFNSYTGVCWSKPHSKWIARVNYKGKTYISSTHQTEEEALKARNNCIKENNLPHPIQQLN